jgi:hypothetical protein
VIDYDTDNDSDEECSKTTFGKNQIAAYFRDNMALEAQKKKVAEERKLHKPTDAETLYSQARWDEMRDVFREPMLIYNLRDLSENEDKVLQLDFTRLGYL